MQIIGGSIIWNATIEMAEDKDLELIDGLRSLGINRNVAKLVTYLKNVQESTTRDIEMATGIRQPDISTAMKTMGKLGRISESMVKNKGRGRPHKICVLHTTMKEIIEHYEAEKAQGRSISNYPRQGDFTSIGTYRPGQIPDGNYGQSHSNGAYAPSKST